MKQLILLNENLILINNFNRYNEFSITKASEEIIDLYITKRQSTPFREEELASSFAILLEHINNNEKTISDDLIKTKHDVDLIFKSKITNKIYLVEIKYNDDHDTGKFVNINRKLLKTYAYVKRNFIDEDVVPILFYFNNKISKGNIYLPEATNIYRGEKFFKTFLNIDYKELDKYFSQISRVCHLLFCSNLAKKVSFG